MSSENHYILYFTREKYLKSSGFGQFAVENSRWPYSMRERAIYAHPSLRSEPSSETMPQPREGQGAAMVHLLWRDVEGVDKRTILQEARGRLLPYRANFNGVGLGDYAVVPTFSVL